MSFGEREGLIARIRHIRRVRQPSSSRARSPAREPDEQELRLIGDRITYLERLVEGLQDSVHRESTRQSARIAELEARTQPAALAQALSREARDRGL